MEPNSPEHFGWSAMCREANGCFPTREAFMKGLAAYEAARPKLPTITGLPSTLPDGTRIVGWRYGRPNADQVWVCMHGTMIRGAAYMREELIAITEADNDRG